MGQWLISSEISLSAVNESCVSDSSGASAQTRSSPAACLQLHPLPAAAGMTDNIPLQPVRRPKRNDSKHRNG